MRVSDYIVDFLIQKGISDVFGYPGGMVTHLMDSFSKRSGEITAHVNYHEQASAFCACGYAQVSGRTGVAYATSGPGATNLITGICNAYFDSVPAVFMTGQVNTFESKGMLGVRQRGFQETDIVSMVKGVTKYSVYVASAEDIKFELEKAWFYAHEGRKGPVLLDIPMDVFRSEIEPQNLRGFVSDEQPHEDSREKAEQIVALLKRSARPVLLIGAGVKIAHAHDQVRELAEKWNIPVVSSMLACDVFAHDADHYFGFIGAYGSRIANFIIAKSDLVISMGARLDVRQVGARRNQFAEKAELIRIDIDSNEFTNKVKENELQIQCDVAEMIGELLNDRSELPQTDQWLRVCEEIRNSLKHIDDREPNQLVREFSKKLPENAVITTDVGQNQVWVAQSFEVKRGQSILFSGGHGAMGYSLPAAIGAYYGGGRPVICFNGDGGIQMNLQELQFIARERLPITIVIMNNNALGMIRHFQEMYFEANYCQTVKSGGYTVPDFSRIADAYGIPYCRIESMQDCKNYGYQSECPQIVEIMLENPTYVFPKLEFGKPNQDQEPLIERALYHKLMAL